MRKSTSDDGGKIPCFTCKFENTDTDSEPCAHCVHNSTGDHYEPMTNGERLAEALRSGDMWDAAAILAGHGFTVGGATLEGRREMAVRIHEWLGMEADRDE